MIYADFESILYLELMEIKIQTILVQINIKIMLGAVMISICYVFMINLTYFLSHIYIKMLFKNLCKNFMQEFHYVRTSKIRF